MVNLFHGVIKKEGRSLRMEHGSGEVSYQTFLALTHIPDKVSFPDCEWIYYMQRLNEQAEVCIHIRNHEHREALKLLGDQRKKIGSNIDNITETNKHEIPLDLWDNKAALEALEQELKAGKYPLMDVAVTFCLADKSAEELENKVLRVRQRYEDMNCTIERPLTDQLDLFMHSFPGVGFTVADFMMKLPPPALAAGMIGATHQLGDAVGFPIGTTGEGYKPVFLDMRLACLHNMSACATFYGDLGFGKSFNANLLLYLHVMNGGYWRDTLPVDAVRLNRIVTGTYNQALKYKIVGYTSSGRSIVIADNLSTTQNHVVDCSPLAVGLNSGEIFTSFSLHFGTAKAGFTQVSAPKVYVDVLPSLGNAYQFVNKADVGGKYNNEWIITNTTWTTKVYNPGWKLPKTGY